MKITSPAFQPTAELPALYTSDDANLSPPLQWSEVPLDTKSLVLIAEDDEADAEPWTHWLVYNIPPATTETLEGKAPIGGQEGAASNGKRHYKGPSPKILSGTHRYVFRLYALDETLDFDDLPDRQDIAEAMEGRVLAEAELPSYCAGHASQAAMDDNQGVVGVS
jgi:Raf kinase inhibitor-like YbhB/YbcL family protein